MNFKNYESDIEHLFLLPDKRESGGKTKRKVKQFHKGVYVISRDLDDNTHKIGVAYGAGGLFNRVKSYKICMPYKDEFFLQYAFVSATGDDAKQVEKEILESKTIKYVDANPSAQGKRSLEYRVSSSRDILNGVIFRVLDSFPNLWTHAVVFGQQGWKIHVNKGAAVRGFHRPTNASKLQPRLYSLSSNETETRLTGKEKVGDKINTQWGVATITNKISKNKIKVKWDNSPDEFILDIK